jgi:hypothetical protein
MVDIIEDGSIALELLGERLVNSERESKMGVSTRKRRVERETGMVMRWEILTPTSAALFLLRAPWLRSCALCDASLPDVTGARSPSQARRPCWGVGCEVTLELRRAVERGAGRMRKAKLEECEKICE